MVECLPMTGMPSTGPAAPPGGAGTESGAGVTAAATSGQPASRRFGALRHRNFALLWSGLLLSNSGTWMQGTAQGYLAYQLTSSPLALGLLGFSFAIPMLLLPPLGGVLADRVDRLALMKIANVAWIVMTTVLAFLTWTGRVEFWHILTVSFLSAVTLAFDNPTRQALVPDLVPRADLLSAISLNSVAFTGASLLGPAIAGQI
ncbi:MAG TPA: MFS transporter, partial [Chloroflexota bacterium]|nr:MFS transporter [Chloroflexota bacterium]